MAAAPDLPLADRVARYDHALADFVSLAGLLGPPEWPLPTDLPGWTVQDNVSHVVGIESALLGRPAPEHTPDWAALPHVRDEMGRFVEVAVDARRHTPPAAVLAELVEVVAARRTALAAAVLDPAGLPPGFLGSVDRLLALRPFDVWVHEQDVRRAVGRPGNLDGAGALAARDQLLRALPYVVGKEVAPPPGMVVRWEVSGPLVFTATVAVGADGRATALPGGQPAQADVRLVMGWETFVLLGCGRRPAESLDVEVEGDGDLAARVLAAMPITP